jgi:uncharacterized protein YkwD
MVVSFFLPAAWGQLRIRSGASMGGIQHSKVLEERIFQFTNEARRKNGLPPLELDQTLAKLARAKSDDMIKRHYFSHPDPEGKNIRDRYFEEVQGEDRRMIGLGENISTAPKNDYQDSETTAREIVDGFMVSPGHRSNILQPRYTHLGVGVSVSADKYYVTQDFGVMKGP